MTMSMRQDGWLFLFLLACALAAHSQAFLGPSPLRRCAAFFRGTDCPPGAAGRGLRLAAAARDAAQQAALRARDDGRRGDRDTQTWREAEVVASRPACPSGKSTLVEVRVDEETLREYATPGQFVQLRPDDDTTEPIFLAISSAPTCNATDVSTLQFLIKMSPRLPWLAATLTKGTTVRLSPVAGAGFPLERLASAAAAGGADAGAVVLAAAGSGIAPLKACIESGRLGPRAVLHYGEWTADDLCFAELFAQWKEAHGVEVRPALSRASEGRGYVQDALARDGAAAGGEAAWALLCGMDAMVEDCTRVLREAGVDGEHILLNV